MKNILTEKNFFVRSLTFVFRYRDTDWFVRVGDNYMASRDPSEQTFQVHMNRPPNLLISPSSSTQSLIQSCHQSNPSPQNCVWRPGNIATL